MELVFCGTPQFAVPSLAALVEAADFHVRLVVCQPDRPAGRGLTVTAPPVKQFALQHGIPVAQPEQIKNNAEFRAQLEGIRPQAIAVVAYGRILPSWMLQLPLLGNINLHASLLPKYRGAAPIQWAIARGETVTGVTTMHIDAGLDTGDILLARELPIAPDETAEALAPRLAVFGAPLLAETLRGLKAGVLASHPQEHAAATLAPLLKKEDGRIDFQRNAHEIWNRLRGFTPWPGAYTRFRGKSLHLWNARPASANPEMLSPGQMHSSGDRLFVGCGQETALEVFEVQMEGKKRMTARDFVNGYKPKPGDICSVVNHR
jgi:methionyl-tRNA formyltransferase